MRRSLNIVIVWIIPDVANTTAKHHLRWKSEYKSSITLADDGIERKQKDLGTEIAEIFPSILAEYKDQLADINNETILDITTIPAPRIYNECFMGTPSASMQGPVDTDDVITVFAEYCKFLDDKFHRNRQVGKSIVTGAN
jgi:hypothetical protein